MTTTSGQDAAQPTGEESAEKWRLIAFAAAGGITVTVGFVAWMTFTNGWSPLAVNFTLAVFVVAWVVAIVLVAVWAIFRFIRCRNNETADVINKATMAIIRTVTETREAAALGRWSNVLDEEQSRVPGTVIPYPATRSRRLGRN